MNKNQYQIELIITKIKMQYSQIPFHYEHKQSCPVTLNNSNQVSFEQLRRKCSMASLNNQIDIDKLMIDIKLTPLKSNQFQQKIRTIYTCLEYLKKMSPSLIQQVRTAQLIIQNIQSKILKQSVQTQRTAYKNGSVSKKLFQSGSSKPSTNKIEEQVLLSKRKANQNVTNIYSKVSPIKQLDEMTSRIVYTNFSIKELQSSYKNSQSSRVPFRQSKQRHSLIKRTSQKQMTLAQSKSVKQIRGPSGSKLKTNTKQMKLFTVSKFDPQDQEIQRLTKNIQALDKVLYKKGLCIKNQSQMNSKVALKQNYKNIQINSIYNSNNKPLFTDKKNKLNSNKQNWYC